MPEIRIIVILLVFMELCIRGFEMRGTIQWRGYRNMMWRRRYGIENNVAARESVRDLGEGRFGKTKIVHRRL